MAMTMQTGSKDITLAKLFEKFMAYKKIDNVAEDTVIYYDKCFKTFCEFYDSQNMCSEISKDICLEYVSFLRAKNTMKDVTINTRLRGIRAILYYGMEHGYISEFKVRLIKADKEIKETYTDEELLRLLKKPDTKTCDFTEYRNWVIINYLLATGNRLSTVTNLKIEDIVLADGMIMLKKTKNRKQQIIPLSNTMIKILQEYLEFRQGNPSDYLFCNRFGNQFTRGGFETAILDYNRSRGVQKRSVHLFRHTFAKKWILNGGDIFRLQKILGHSSLEIVKEYLNFFGTDLQQQFNDFNPLENIYSDNNLHSNKALSLTRKKK